MIRRIPGWLARCAKRATAVQFRSLPPDVRAQLMEELASEMTLPVRVKNRELHMVVTSPLLLARARTMLTKEKDTIEWIDGFANDAVFWDVGANVGIFSLYAALESDRKVLAFEPSASNYGVLCKNVRINRLSNVQAYCLAFARDTRLGVLNLYSVSVGAALNQFGDEGDVSRYAERTADNTIQAMLGFSLDHFIANVEPPFPNYLKVDVDGIELPIFEGAEKTLRDPRLKSVLAELTVSDEQERARTVAYLKGRGLELTGQGENQTAGEHVGRNHIFVRNDERRSHP